MSGPKRISEEEDQRIVNAVEEYGKEEAVRQGVVTWEELQEAGFDVPGPRDADLDDAEDDNREP
jgi:hypothetical protein